VTVPKNVLTINLRTAEGAGAHYPAAVLSGADVVLE